jgi:hypothetical protein
MGYMRKSVGDVRPVDFLCPKPHLLKNAGVACDLVRPTVWGSLHARRAHPLWAEVAAKPLSLRAT